MSHPNDRKPYQRRYENRDTGQTHLGNWEQTLFCTDGRCVTGEGLTEEECQTKAEKLRTERNAFLAQPAVLQLKQLMANHGPHTHILSTEASDMIKLLAQIVLQDK